MTDTKVEGQWVHTQSDAVVEIVEVFPLRGVKVGWFGRQFILEGKTAEGEVVEIGSYKHREEAEHRHRVLCQHVSAMQNETIDWDVAEDEGET